MNLLVNAIDAIEDWTQHQNFDVDRCDRGYLKITTEATENQHVLIRIYDEGGGIDDATKNRLFHDKICRSWYRTRTFN